MKNVAWCITRKVWGHNYWISSTGKCSIHSIFTDALATSAICCSTNQWCIKETDQLTGNHQHSLVRDKLCFLCSSIYIIKATLQTQSYVHLPFLHLILIHRGMPDKALVFLCKQFRHIAAWGLPITTTCCSNPRSRVLVLATCLLLSLSLSLHVRRVSLWRDVSFNGLHIHRGSRWVSEKGGKKEKRNCWQRKREGRDRAWEEKPVS